jgi:hypothetical protein
MEAQKQQLPEVDKPELPANPPAVVENAPEAQGVSSVDSTTTETPNSITTESSMPSEGTVSPDDVASTEESVEIESSVPNANVPNANEEVVEGEANINPDVLTPQVESSSASKQSDKDESIIDEADKFRNYLISYYSRKTKKNKQLNEYDLTTLKVERNRLIDNFIDVLRISKKTGKKSVKQHFKKLGNIRNIYNKYLNIIDINTKEASRKLTPAASPSKKGGKTRKTKLSNKK